MNLPRILEDPERLGEPGDVEKLLPLKNMPPGTYTLKVKATDKKGNQTLQHQTTNFTVN